MILQIFENIDNKLSQYKSSVKDFDAANNEKSKNEITFVFVKSEFVQAIENGHWVLLDNVNSAPPEVMERINSLLEESPILNLYEYSDGVQLTLENGGIDPRFRLFSTANMQRVNSNKLSSAFLNRVIRIWLPAIDHNLKIEDPQANELYHHN